MNLPSDDNHFYFLETSYIFLLFSFKGTNSLGFHDKEELGPNFDWGNRARVKGIQGELAGIILGAFGAK